MESLKNKNSEDFALLAMAQGFSIQFMGMKAAFYSKSIANYIEKAQTHEPENIRAWYVYCVPFDTKAYKQGGRTITFIWSFHFIKV